jgi:murein DD-endopeptidase MepM/ murein hydrolase activator NlpD
MFYKLSIQELITPMQGNKIPLDDKIEGAEDVLLQAIEANKRYEKWYDYKSLPLILNIAERVGKSKNFSSIEFARNIYLYQIDNLGVPKKQADGQFDPPFIEKVAKKLGIDLSEVYSFWKNKLKGNWLGNRWLGRRLVEERKEGVYQYPVKSAQIVGDFTGSRPSDKYHSGGHWGVDFGNAPKGTPIFPIAPGEVIAAGDFGKGGNALKIDHGNGVISYYAHNDSLNVKKGDVVDYDTIIARMGASGNARGSIHLHLSVKIGGSYVDPMKIIGTPVRGKIEVK